MQQKLINNCLSSFVCYLVSVVCCLWSANDPSTTVENPLQIDPFMQNKPNVKYAQINVSSFITSKYVKVDNWWNQKNKPNSNPNKPNCRKGKNWCKACIHKGLWREMRLRAMKKQSQNKPNFLKAKMTTRRRCFKHTLIAPALVGNNFCCQKNHAFSYRT